MEHSKPNIRRVRRFPDWVPDAVQLYLSHTADGRSLRALARERGCHASTVLRQVRRFESRRDDPLVDEALNRLGSAAEVLRSGHDQHEDPDMTVPVRSETMTLDAGALGREAPRILRRLAEPGAVLAIAPDMENAVVLREDAGGRAQRTAVLERRLAEAMALKEWIACQRPGRVATYAITAAGRAALRRFAEDDPEAFGADERSGFGSSAASHDEDDAPRRPRYGPAESPVSVLARRRDRDGAPFLGPELVAAAERLREDFELAQMAPRIGQNWDRFLSGPERGDPSAAGERAAGPVAARARVADALRELGPGLGDMALRCCCYLEGLESAERRLGWSARSGKIVLRIALQRLRRHYDTLGREHGMIG